jgi:hypothetical protein
MSLFYVFTSRTCAPRRGSCLHEPHPHTLTAPTPWFVPPRTTPTPSHPYHPLAVFCFTTNHLPTQSLPLPLLFFHPPCIIPRPNRLPRGTRGGMASMVTTLSGRFLLVPRRNDFMGEGAPIASCLNNQFMRHIFCGYRQFLIVHCLS